MAGTTDSGDCGPARADDASDAAAGFCTIGPEDEQPESPGADNPTAVADRNPRVVMVVRCTVLPPFCRSLI